MLTKQYIEHNVNVILTSLKHNSTSVPLNFFELYWNGTAMERKWKSSSASMPTENVKLSYRVYLLQKLNDP